jgi:hypothetical protein
MTFTLGICRTPKHKNRNGSHQLAMFHELPTEVLLGVARYLHADSICRLRGVCRLLRDVLEDDRLFAGLARYYSRRGFASLMGRGLVHSLDMTFKASSRATFVANLLAFRERLFPVFCCFFSTTELCFGNCLTGEMVVVPSHLTPPAHASLDWVENGKKRDSAVASNAISLLFALAKEHRRNGVCVLVESACFEREVLGRRPCDQFPQLVLHFEALPLLLGGLFPDDCCVLILEDDRTHGWGVVDGAVALKICPPRSAASAVDLRRHVSGLKRSTCPLREKHTVAAEEQLVQFALRHSHRRIVLVGGDAERIAGELTLWRHEPQLFHCVFRALVGKAKSIRYGVSFS